MKYIYYYYIFIIIFHFIKYRIIYKKFMQFFINLI